MLRRPLPPPPPPAPLPLHSLLALLCSPPTVLAAAEAAAVALSEAFKTKILLSLTSPPTFLSTSPPTPHRGAHRSSHRVPIEMLIEVPTAEIPSNVPTEVPIEVPVPTEALIEAPTESPIEMLIEVPTAEIPSNVPTEVLIEVPVPIEAPIEAPTEFPTEAFIEFPIEIPTDDPIEAPIPIRLPADDRSFAARRRATEIVRLAKIRAAENRMADFSGEVITVEAEIHAPPDNNEDADERVVCTANTFCTKYWQYHHTLVQI